MENIIPIISAAAFWLYAVNAAVLLLHEIESAYWKEWQLFRLKGGIQGFLIAHVPMLALLFWGLIEAFLGRATGNIISLVLAAAGISAFFIHRHFIRRGRKGFSLPASRIILRSTLALSIMQLAVNLSLLIVRNPAAAAFSGKILAVAGLSALELWGGIPLGFALGLHPIVTAIVAVSGTAAISAVVAFGGAAIRKRFLRKKRSKKNGLIMRIWQRFGVIGLGLLAPWTTGAPIGVAIAIALKADPKRVFLWTTAGVVLCAVILTVIGALGVNAFHHR